MFNELDELLDIDKVLEMPAKTISRNDEKRTYGKLLKGRFDVNVCRIDREDDENTISALSLRRLYIIKIRNYTLS